MRISFILSSLWLSGGVRVVVEYANRLALRGHIVTLVFPKDAVDSEVAQELNPKVNLHTGRAINPLSQSHANLFKKALLSWSLAYATPSSDIVISTHTPTTISGWIATRLLRRGIPVWFFQDYIEMFDNRPVEQWLLRNSLKWNRLALTVSKTAMDELRRYTKGLVMVVGEGLNHTSFFPPIEERKGGSQSGIRNILFLGDMRPRKGLSDFLEAASYVHEHLPGIFLWIVSKESCSIDTNIPYRFYLRPSNSELAHLYTTCDLFVSASWSEGFGLPPLEAMACGAPVVVTDSRGVREYAEHEVNCLISPARNPSVLAECMMRVLTNSELEEKFRRNGPPTAKQFTWDYAVDRFEKALLDLS